MFTKHVILLLVAIILMISGYVFKRVDKSLFITSLLSIYAALAAMLAAILHHNATGTSSWIALAASFVGVCTAFSVIIDNKKYHNIFLIVFCILAIISIVFPIF
ncbi:MAG: hypothetical protein HOC78_00465 [Candidatus Komeilibacteria bacterium]|jgi:hypothetical protein|nr:hypothetical protein [Candidatus Komeilibacteria bacterium]